MKNWLWLIAASLTEVGWVAGLKAATDLWHWLATAFCVVASVCLALRATRTMATTTVYILFVGLGNAGTVTLDWLVFDAALSPALLMCLAALVAGIVGLELTATDAR